MKIPSNYHWYVLYTYPQYEKKVFESLLKSKCETFLPTHKVKRVWSDRIKQIQVPLFPNYVFVRLKADERFKVLDVRGVCRFISCGGIPVKVSDKEINIIEKMAQAKNLTAEERFIPGDKVYIEGGAFDGIEGQIINKNGKNRFFVEISSLKQYLSVDISEHYLIKV